MVTAFTLHPVALVAVQSSNTTLSIFSTALAPLDVTYTPPPTLPVPVALHSSNCAFSTDSVPCVPSSADMAPPWLPPPLTTQLMKEFFTPSFAVSLRECSSVNVAEMDAAVPEEREREEKEQKDAVPVRVRADGLNATSVKRDDVIVSSPPQA